MSWSISSAFRSKMESTCPSSIYRDFVFDGADISHLLLEYPIVQRRNNDLVGDILTAVFDNTSQSFNSYVGSPGNYLTENTSMGFGFTVSPTSTEVLGIFNGRLSETQLSGMQAYLTFDDILARANEISLRTYVINASSPPPDKYEVYKQTHDARPNSLCYQFWNSQASEFPLGIPFDFASAHYWGEDLETNSIFLDYHSFGNSLLEDTNSIRELTDSSFTVDLDNKLYFHRWSGISSSTITLVDSTIIEVMQARSTTDDILNSVDVYYGYNHLDKVNSSTGLIEITSEWWDGFISVSNSASISKYGERKKIFSNKEISCSNSFTAARIADRIIHRRSVPNMHLKVRTPLVALEATVGDLIKLTYAPYQFDQKQFVVQGYELDINKGEIVFEMDDGHGKFSGMIPGFVLDDTYWGLLDQNYNFLV